MPIQTSENFIVDLTQITPAFENFFYRIFQIPPEVPITKGDKVSYYMDVFLNLTIGKALDNPMDFIINIGKQDFLSRVISEDLEIITQNIEGLRYLALYALNHITLSIKHDSEIIYIINLLTRDYMVISAHKLNEEADTLVYS